MKDRLDKIGPIISAIGGEGAEIVGGDPDGWGAGRRLSSSRAKTPLHDRDCNTQMSAPPLTLTLP